jgi:hypothetical protein
LKENLFHTLKTLTNKQEVYYKEYIGSILNQKQQQNTSNNTQNIIGNINIENLTKLDKTNDLINYPQQSLENHLDLNNDKIEININNENLEKDKKNNIIIINNEKLCHNCSNQHNDTQIDENKINIQNDDHNESMFFTILKEIKDLYLANCSSINLGFLILILMINFLYNLYSNRNDYGRLFNSFMLVVIVLVSTYANKVKFKNNNNDATIETVNTHN